MIGKNVLQNFGHRLTDYLIGDNPYDFPDGRYRGSEPVENSKKDLDMNETCCNKCKYCLKVLIPSNPPAWIFKCSHPIGDIIVPSGKIIKFRAGDNDIVEKPCWCPIINGQDEQDDNESPEPKTTLKRPKRWEGVVRPSSWEIEKKLEKLKHNISFEDIKEGDIIHIPPTPSEKRMDLLIKNKYVYSATGTVIGNEQKTVYIYSSGLNCAIMSKRKKEDLEV